MAEHRFMDYDVLDSQGRKLGTVEAVWEDDASGMTEFLGVRTTWLVGRIHVVPFGAATVDDANQALRVPFTEEQVKEAPHFGAEEHIAESEEQRIYAHFGMERPSFEQPGSGAMPAEERAHGHRTFRHEEHLRGGAWRPSERRY